MASEKLQSYLEAKRKERGKAVKAALGVEVGASVAKMREAWDALDDKARGHVMAAAIGTQA